jgi:hypothetical protein
MGEIFSGAALTDMLKTYGLPIIVFIIWYLDHVAAQRRWHQQRGDELDQRKADREERDKDRSLDRNDRDRDRSEHMAKWDSMVKAQERQTEMLLKSHSAENDRTYTVLDRQTQALELQGHLMAVLNQKIDTNQFCPIIKKGSIT